MRLECKLGEIIDVLSDDYIDCDLAEYEIPYDEENNRTILVTGMIIKVPELGVWLRQGYICGYDADEEIYIADVSITLIYNENESDPANFSDWGGDEPVIFLYDYFVNKGYSIETIENMNCSIQLDASCDEIL